MSGNMQHSRARTTFYSMRVDAAIGFCHGRWVVSNRDGHSALLELAGRVGRSSLTHHHVGRQGAEHESPLTIAFNGSKECGHRFYDFGEPWPTDNAEGVFKDEAVAENPYWSGEHLNTRMCHGGSCAQGSFVIDRVFMEKHWTPLEKGGYFCKCETQFKPYDLVVTAVLIRLKEHLSDEVFVSSDGQERAFEDAKRFCRELFGWTRYFQVESPESELV